MHNASIPTNVELPSTRTLIKSTVIAIIAAAIILITIVMPAEYGIDPTGFGAVTGLKRMGEIKISLAQESATESDNESTKPVPIVGSESDSAEKSPIGDSAPAANASIRSDEMTIRLAPNQGKEIKLVMKEGSRVEYKWWSDGGKVNFDTHADSKPLQIKYHGYGKGSEQRSEGVLVAAFDGSHGWFWRNRTSETLNVTLQIKGEYSAIREL